MRYLEIKPPKYLRHIVRYFWTLETDVTLSVSKFRIVADGCPGLIYHNGRNGYTFDAEDAGSLPSFFLYGQTTRHGDLCSPGPLQMLGVNFYPHVLKALLGFNADEVTDEVIDMTQIQPNLLDMLDFANSTSHRIKLISNFLARQLDQNPITDSAVWAGIEQIEKGKGNIPIYTLHKDLNLSERQFERRFKQHVGIRPKLFSRIIRFQAALDQIRQNNFENLSDIAFDTGYSDQSHFIREFKEFGGLKPGGYHTRQPAFLCQNHNPGITRN